MPASVLRTVVRDTGYLVKGFAKTLLLLYLPAMAVLTLAHFPYDTDPPLRHGTPSTTAEGALARRRTASFYEAAYGANQNQKRGLDYESVARAAAEHTGMEDQVRQFVKDYRLEDKKVLEVGSGRGYLQDLVLDYTGLDLSAAVAPHYHKPFVAGSATDMPFADSSYDAIWTVWVLEHIPEPERALREMRRVLKPGGVLFLYVAWHCPPWAADGFEVRPYGQFNWRGKLMKASVPARRWLRVLALVPTRAIRWVQYAMAGATEPLRFRALEPNYETYWRPDSDAAISLDSFETYLWFGARGDERLNSAEPLDEWLDLRNPLIVRIRK